MPTKEICEVCGKVNAIPATTGMFRYLCIPHKQEEDSQDDELAYEKEWGMK